MANKFLRRLLRSGLFFFPSIGTHEAASASASASASCAGANKLCSMQKLSHYKWNMQGPPVCAVRSSHFSCAPLQASQYCLPSSSAIYSSANEEQELKHLSRSHSCSKMQGKQLVPSFKSLLRRASSHGHLHNCRSRSGKLHHFAAESSSISASSYTRTWSSPSLKLSAARSFSVSQSKDGRRAGKCAPKGHVAVYVEAGRERQVVPIASLSHPQFRELLERAEREYGYAGQQGPGLRIPCSLSELHHALHRIRTHHSL